jgi:hypothetical protein
MAWPNDARHTEFAAPPAQEIVSSPFPNELQDQIIALNEKVTALFGAEDLTEVLAYPEWDGAAGQPQWVIDLSNPQDGWRCLTNGFGLMFFVRARKDCNVTQVVAKVYNSFGSDAAIPMEIYKPNINEENPSTAPVLGSAIYSNAGTNPATAWSIIDADVDIDLGFGEYLLVCIGKSAASRAGDKVAGIEVTAQPIPVPT